MIIIFVKLNVACKKYQIKFYPYLRPNSSFSPKSAFISRHDLVSEVVVSSIVSSTLTVVWSDTSVVDSGHTNWTFTTGVWLNVTTFLGVGLFGPSTSKWATAGHQAIEDEWSFTLLCWKIEEKNIATYKNQYTNIQLSLC